MEVHLYFLMIIKITFYVKFTYKYAFLNYIKEKTFTFFLKCPTCFIYFANNSLFQ